MRIAVCAPQVPFVRGGAEIFADTLVDKLRGRGQEAELVTMPFKWYPGERVLTQAFLWRLADLEEADGRPIDAVVATKFPSYLVRHPRKVVWLLHQFRQAYELDRTELGQFGESAEDRATLRAVHRVDRTALGEARKVFATSQNVADRLRRSLELDAEVMPHPPQELDYRAGGYEDFVLSVGRLDRAKRIDLLLEAAALAGSVRCVVVGDGPDRERLAALARELGLDGRVEFAGHVDARDLADLYSRCLAVYYAPVDEDFGMVPYEAFLSERPVLTTTDAGGPLEVVLDGRTGLVREPSSRALAEGMAWFREHPAEAAALGRAGRETAERVTWESALDRLLEAAA